jgi:hypothetical protein
MRFGIAVGMVVLATTAGCVRDPSYTGPGCLAFLNPKLAVAPIPVVTDASDLAARWRDAIASAKIVYGTWRFYSEPNFEGFMGDYKAPVDIVSFDLEKKIGSLRCIQPEPAPPRYYY